MPFPSEFTAGDLYSGSILGTVAHAVWTARHPELAHEQRWDGGNYCVQDTSGAYGTVTFDASGLVAAFFDVRSPEAEAYEAGRSRHLAGAPAALVALAEREALC